MCIWAKCLLVCSIENEHCCMACLLSNQADVKNQVSLLKQEIIAHGHICIFHPKFHCELNLIEMMSKLLILPFSILFLSVY
ncbi:hypothetical protein HETIRDRAFT_308975 [Heterobasidion irregulare TC 32-1]|uniref:Uncharacterized protein n=1 Tax=Heterobasidion irregulare (strain TC 32-1) TaxID=747525 RepID=W4KI98_HETIT|nr:uncharacterized protein HETIRDRAFT_308975 [Heterobasidion irregulare TC 32-1]ETW85577.1 hypothetical protein HETIRDRAFT_308975 [Heterobasidion irregulare TC 32-1]